MSAARLAVSLVLLHGSVDAVRARSPSRNIDLMQPAKLISSAPTVTVIMLGLKSDGTCPISSATLDVQSGTLVLVQAP